MSFSNLGIHVIMLADQQRTDGYRKAIFELVQENDTVLDFGAGTGILSFFAAQKTRAAVHALEKTNMIRVAKNLAESNGFENIRFHHGDHEQLALDHHVEVIVCERMGNFGLTENMIPELIVLRDRHLKPDGIMIPARIRLKAGLITDESGLGNALFLKDNPYGIDFSFVADWPLYSVSTSSLKNGQIHDQVMTLEEMDMKTIQNAPRELNGELILSSELKIFGLCGWFEADLSDSVSIATGPMDPKTHWAQLVFPLKTPLHAKKGDRVSVQILPQYMEKNITWMWSVTVGEETIQMDNFVHQAWIMRESVE